MLVLAKPMLVASLLASDFPSENPRTQTRNFPYTNRCATFEQNMKNLVLIIIFLTLNISSFGQSSNDCYKIKYLDFFGLDQIEVVKWTQSELDRLLKVNFIKEREHSEIKTSFIIPMIVYQLKEFHPNCTDDVDTNYFNKISEIYLRIRELDSTEFRKKSIIEKIDFLRDDFYSQVNSVEYLPDMIVTFDDGPFYGVDYHEELDVKPNKIQKTQFGTLIISSLRNKTILTCKDKNGSIIWQKLITGFKNKKLSELHFIENPMEYNSAAAVAHMYSEGEKLTLYLKIDGGFMFYFHSW
ncbi:hypothetical protein N1F78_01035 [Seonamhaeicola sp. MEBiC1930]|uniref:hypothetical protein n=1 Tax=Seonamhaeicola sp. MEBiC01930 TaxID=2976768 RepID=UPI003248991C